MTKAVERYRCLIVAHTHAGRAFCVGAMTTEGEALRLCPSYEQFAWPTEGCPFEWGGVYEVDGTYRASPDPPHVEDFIVADKSWSLIKRLTVDGVREAVRERAVVWTGPLGRYPSDVFDGAVIITRGMKPQVRSRPLPKHPVSSGSVGFWRTPCELERSDGEQGVRYSVPVSYRGEDFIGSIAYVGTADPVAHIPRNVIVRLSLSRSPGDFHTVMLSGWFI